MSSRLPNPEFFQTVPKYPLPALDRKRLAASFFRAFSLLALVGLLPLEAKQASAQDLSWNPSLSSGSMLGGSGTWSSTGVTNWWNGATNQTWTNGGTARFTGMGGSVNVSSGISVGAMWFNAPGSGYTLMGSSLALSGGGGSQVSVQTVSDATIMVPLTGSAGLSKSGTGTLMVTLAGSYLGGTSINAGTVIYTQGGLPGTGAVAVGSGGNLQFNIVSAGANVPLTQSISLSGTLVKQGSGKLSLNTQPTGSGNVEVKGGTLTVAGTGGLLGMNGYWVEPGATLEMNTPNAGMVSTMEVGMLSGSGILSKVGSGTLALSGVSSFSGALKVGGGVLTVGSNTFNSVSSAQILAGGTVMAKDFAYDDYWEGVTVAVGGSITTNNGRRINWGKYRWSVGGSGMWDGAANSWVDDNQVAQNWNSVGYTGVPVSFPDSAGAARTVTVQSGAGMAFSVRGLHFGYGPNGSNYTLAGGSLRLVGGGEVRIDTEFGVYAQISSALLGENQGGGYFSVRKVGSGTAVLAGPSQGINRAQVNAGTLKFANSADLTHDFEVQGGAVLEVERFGPDSIQDAYFLAAGSGTLVKSGSGTLKLEGSAGFTGQVRVIGGTLFFPNIGTPLLSGSSGQVVVQSGAVLQVNTAMTAMTLPGVQLQGGTVWNASGMLLSTGGGSGGGALAITSQPGSQTVSLGGTVNFSVVASGSGTLSYQWKKDGADLPGQNSASLHVTNVNPAQVGHYTCMVSDGSGAMVTSNLATLSIPGVDFGIWQGLVAYYPFNGGIADETRLLSNPLAYGSPSLSLDRFGNSGKAYQFNGSSGYIDVGKPVGSNPSSFTQAAWVKITARQGDRDVIITQRNLGEDHWTTLAIGPDGKAVLAIDAGANLSLVTGTSVIPLGTWAHVCSVRSGSEYRLYVNGQLEASQTNPVNMAGASSNMHFMHHGAWGFFTNGSLDDVRIYNRALTSVEVSALYSSEAPAPTPSLLTWDANPGASGVQAGGGSWSLSGANWMNSGTNYVWPANGMAQAVFGGTVGGGTVSVDTRAGEVKVNGMRFEAGSEYVVVGGQLKLAGTSNMFEVPAGAWGRVDSVLSAYDMGSFSTKQLVKQGSGLLELGGGSDYYVWPVVQAGTLRYVGSATLSSGSLTIQAGARLELAQTMDLSIYPSLSGNGQLVKTGPAKVTFNGNVNGFTGEVRVEGGTLGVSSYSSLLNAGSLQIRVLNGAALQVEGISTPMQLTNVVLESGGQLVGSNGYSVTIAGPQPPYTLTWDANPGASGVQAGGGSWSLSGANWMNSGTNYVWPFNGMAQAVFGGGVTGGGTVSVDTGAGNVKVSGMRFEAGSSYVVGGGQLNLAGTSNLFEVPAGVLGRVDSPLSGYDMGSYSTKQLVKQGFGVLELGGGYDYQVWPVVQAGTLRFVGSATLSSGSLTIQGGARVELGQTMDQWLYPSLSGSGQLVKTGTGKVKLGGSVNGFTGEVRVEGGTLGVSTYSGLLNAGSLQIRVLSGAALQVEYQNGPMQLTNVVLESGGQLLGSDGYSVTIAGPQPPYTLTWDANPGASGVQAGGGSWSLSGANWVNSGTNYVWPFNGMAQAVFGGGVTGGGTVNVDPSAGNVKVSGMRFEAGSSYVVGGGQLKLAGTSNMFEVPAGVLGRVDSVLSGYDMGSYSTKQLVKQGLGVLELGGASDYQVWPVVQAGTLRYAGSAMLSSGSLTIQGGARLELAQTMDQWLYPSLSGSGQLVKTGTAKVTLGGNANGFTGEVRVEGGTLELQNGDVLNNLSQLTVGPGATLRVGEWQGNSMYLAQAVVQIDPAAEVLNASGVPLTITGGRSSVPQYSASLLAQRGMVRSVDLASTLGGVYEWSFMAPDGSGSGGGFWYPGWIELNGGTLTARPRPDEWGSQPFQVKVGAYTNGILSSTFLVSVSLFDTPWISGTMTVATGGSLHLTVSGTGGLSGWSSQWYLNGGSLEGTQGQSVYARSGVSSQNAGTYTVRFSEPGGGQIESAPVPVRVVAGSVSGAIASARGQLVNAGGALPTQAVCESILTQLNGLDATGQNDPEVRFLRAFFRFGKMLSSSAAENALRKVGFERKQGELFWSFDSTLLDVPKPQDALSSVFTQWLQTTAYPELSAISDDLNLIPPGFLTVLTQQELLQTSDRPTYVDYGDAQIFRGQVLSLMALSKWAEAYHTDVDLNQLRAMQVGGLLSFEKVLGLYPQLLTSRGANSPNALAECRAKFAGAANALVAALNFIAPMETPANPSLIRKGSSGYVFNPEPGETLELVRTDATQVAESLSASSPETAGRVWDAKGWVESGTGVFGSKQVPFNAYALLSQSGSGGMRSGLPSFQRNGVVPLSLSGSGTMSSAFIRAVLPNANPAKAEWVFSRQQRAFNETFGTRLIFGPVLSLSVLQGGTWYSSSPMPPSLVFSSNDLIPKGGAGSLAVSGGKITAGTLTNGGTYLSAPKVDVVGGGGIGALLLATQRPIHFDVVAPVSTGTLASINLSSYVNSADLPPPYTFTLVGSGPGGVSILPGGTLIANLAVGAPRWVVVPLRVTSSAGTTTRQGFVTLDTNGSGTPATIPVHSLAGKSVPAGGTLTFSLLEGFDVTTYSGTFSVVSAPAFESWVSLSGTAVTASPGLFEPVRTVGGTIRLRDQSAPTAKLVDVNVSLSVTAPVWDGSYAQPLVLGGNTPFEFNILSGKHLVLGGSLSGSQGVNKLGGGTLSLSGVNSSYGGVISVQSGMLNFGGSNFGRPRLEVLQNGAVMVGGAQTVSMLSGSGGVTLLGTLTLDVSNPGSFEGMLSGSGGLVKAGPAMFTLAGSNNGYSGLTRVQGGTLRALSPGGFGQGSLQVDGGGVLNYDVAFGNAPAAPSISGSGVLWKSGMGRLELQGTALSYSGQTFVTDGTLAFSGPAMAGQFSSLSSTRFTVTGTGSVLEFGNVGTLTMGSEFVGGGRMEKTGSGLLNLSGSSSLAGGVFVQNGTLAYSGPQAINAGGIEVASNGRLEIPVWSGSAEAKVRGGGLLVKQGGGMLTLQSMVNGVPGTPRGGNGSASAPLEGQWGGTISVASGTLRVVPGVLMDAGTIELASSATLVFDGFTSDPAFTVLQVTGGGNRISVNGVPVTWNGGGTNVVPVVNYAVSVPAGGNQSIRVAQISGMSSYVAPFSVVSPLPNPPYWVGVSGSGALLSLSFKPEVLDFGTLYSGTLRLADSGNPSKMVDLAVSSALVAGAMNGTRSQGYNLPADQTFVIQGSDVLSLSGPVSGAGRIVKQGQGTMVLSSGSNAYAGLEVQLGTVRLAGSNTLAPLSIAGSGLVIVSAPQRVSSLSGSGALQITGGSLVVDSQVHSAFSGPISGANGLVKAGPANLTLSGTNLTYSGGTTIQSGTLFLGANNVLPFGRSVWVAGGVLNLGNTTQNVGNVGVSSGLLTGGTLAASGFAVQSGVADNVRLVGSGGLVKSGSGEFSIQGSGSIAYSGTTWVNSGTLRLRPDSFAQGSLRNVVVSPGATLFFDQIDRSYDLSTALTISGSGIVASSNPTYEVRWNGGAVGGAYPVILQQPLAQTVIYGGTVELSVQASVTNGGSLAYQWKKVTSGGAQPVSGPNVQGATSGTLRISGVQLADAGRYLVEVFNLASGQSYQTASNTVSVDVNTALQIVSVQSQPAQTVLPLGAPFHLSVQTAGVPPEWISYRWTRSGAAVDGGTFQSFGRSQITFADQGDYRVEVSALGTTVQSGTVAVRVGTPQLQWATPVSQAVITGGTAVLAVNHVNAAVLPAGTAVGYEWSFNGVPLATGTSAITLSNVTSANSGQYQVRVSAGTFGFSTAVSLLQVAGVAITAQPQDLQLRAADASGSGAQGGTLSVVAEGPSLTYEWFRSGSNTVLGTGPTLILPTPTLLSSGGYDVEGLYFVRVRGSVGGSTVVVQSNSARVTVFEPVSINNSLFTAQGRTLDPGQRLTLQAYAKGTGPLSYAWYNGGTLLAGSSGFFSKEPVSASDAGVYRVVVVQGTASLQSGTIQIVVNQPPQIGSILVNNAIPEGNAVSLSYGQSVGLSVSPAPVPGVSYLWRRNGVPLRLQSGTVASGGTYVLTATSLDQQGSYDVVASNSVGSTRYPSVQVTLSNPPVTIDSPLANLTVLEGASNVKWTGFQASNATNYRWFFGGSALASASASSPVLEFPPISLNNAGTYTVSASNGFSSRQSSAQLVVLRPVGSAAISGVGTALSGGTYVTNPGGTLPFSASASGDSKLYQWLLNGRSIQGATQASFTLPSSILSDANPHRLEVRVYNQDPSGKVLSTTTSAPVYARVRSLVSVDLAVVQGGTYGSVVFSTPANPVTLRAAVQGDTEGLTFRWFRSGQLIPNATGQNYSIPATETAGGEYSVSVRNLVNEAFSQSRQVVAKVAPRIVVQPVGRVTGSGKTVRFSVEAVASGTLAYQWRKNGSVVSSSGPVYEIPSVSAADEGSYDVVVTSTDLDSSTSVATSDPADLVVNDAISIQSMTVDQPRLLQGGSALFTVVLNVPGAESESAQYRFQWRRNGQTIPGGVTRGVVAGGSLVTSSLELIGAKASDQGDYDVIVRRGGAAVSSPVARLDVYAPIAVSVSPAAGNTAALPSENVVLKATVSGDVRGTLSYQWTAVSPSGSVTALAQQGDGTQLSLSATDELTQYRVSVSASVDGLPPRTSQSVPVPVKLLPAPVLIQQPLSLAVTAGEPANFAAQTSGEGVQYRWERLRSGRWVTITGATGNSLTLASALLSDEGAYRVIVSNARGQVTSSEAMLSVRPVDVILTQPLSQAVNPGDTAVFTVVARGVDLAYQWRKNGVAIPDANAASLALSAQDAASAAADKSSREGVYDVVVTHAFGSSVSTAARLTVNEPVTIRVQPADTALAEGRDARLYVVASGTPSLAYQWYRQTASGAWEMVANATGASLVVVPDDALRSSGKARFQVAVTNVVGTVVSSAAEVAYSSPVAIVSHPADQRDVNPGQKVLFAVQATGTSLRYQWRKDGVPLGEGERGASGVNGAILTLESVDPGSETDLGSAGRYDVVVSNSVNAVASQPAVLTVNAPPVILVQPVSQMVNAGDGARFSVVARGPSLTYAWRRNGAELLNQTKPELIIPNATGLFGGTYDVVVSNASGRVTSTAATLNEFGGLSFSSSAAAQTAPDPTAPVTVGSASNREISRVLNSGTLLFVAPGLSNNGSLEIRYQWRKNGVALQDATASSYLLQLSSTELSGIYDVVISAWVGGAEKARIVSPASLLTVNGPPTIAPMARQTVAPGQTVLFRPVTQGVGTLTHSWFKPSGAPIIHGSTVVNGGTVSSNSANGYMSMPNIALAEAGMYRLDVADSATGLSASGTVEVVVTTAVQVSLKANGLAVSGSSMLLNARNRLVLDAVATGEGPFTYQWRFNGANVSGAVRSRFEIPSVLATHSGRYDVAVSGASGRVASNPLSVSVREPMRITTQPPAEVSVNQGGTLQLSVGTTPSGQGETYQWFRGIGRAAQMIAGGSQSTLTIPAVTGADRGLYMVMVTPANGQSRISSTTANVRVNEPAVIVAGPSARTATPGQSVTFQVVATGTNPLYQWLRDGVRIPGANAEIYRIPSVSVADEADYSVVVSNLVNPQGQTSAAAHLSVSKPVQITAQPLNVTLSAGVSSGTLLSVAATGDGTLSYRWRRYGVELGGQDGPNLLISGTLSTRDSGVYDVVVRNTVSNVEVSRVESRQATVVITGTGAAVTGVLPEVVMAKEGDNVSFPSYATVGETATWARTSGGTLSSGATVAAGGASLSLRGVKASDAGDYTATLSGGGSVLWQLQVLSIPVITAQPQPLVGAYAVKPGDSATLSAQVEVSTGIDPNSAYSQQLRRDTRFQWYYQSSANSASYLIPGANSNTLTIGRVSESDEGYYRLEVTNPAGVATSDLAQLHVLTRASVSASLVSGGSVSGGALVASNWLAANASLVSGGSVTGGVPVTRIDPSAGSASTQVTLMANAQGDLIDGAAYQWFVYRSASRAWQPIPGAVDSLLTLSGAQRVHDTYYRVTAYGKVGGGVDSAPLRLLVNENVSFDRNLRRQTITLAEGDNATLGVNVNGYQPRYEWRFTGTGPSTVVASGTLTGSLTGGTLLTYPIVNAGTVHAGTYSVTLWNGFTNPVTRDIAVVSVRTAPLFSDPNLAVGGNAVSESLGFARVAEGGSVSLTASLGTGCAPFTYQWRRDGRLLPATGGLQTSGSFAVDQPSLQVSFPASASDSGIYDLVLSNNWGSVVTRPVSLAVDRRPFIVTQPAPASAAENGSANFSVEAVGAGTLSYAWFMSGSSGFARSGSSVVLDGATLVGNTRLLARTNLSVGSSGREFAVQVSTDYPGLAPVVSQAAKLTVTRPGDFTVAISGTLNGSPLAGSSVSPGASLGFTATVSGSGSFSYQWRKNGLVLPGKVGSTLSIPSVLGDTGGAYDVVATDGANFAYSAPLIVEVDPRIDAFDVPASVNPGDGVKLSVTAVTASGRTLSYKWFKGTTLLSSGNSSTLTIASASASDAGDYSVEVTSTLGGSSSALRSVTKAMTVNGVVSITSQPEGGILASQRPLSLSVGALNATSYQWYRTLVSTGVRTKLENGSGISGATSSTLNLISVTESDSGVYQVEVSNSGGSVTSAPAKVQVLPPLSVTLNSLPVTPVGGGVNLVASVQGAESPVYAWYFTPSAGGARTRLQGQNADRLKLNPVAVENDGNYEVEVQDGARSVSANTTLSVLRVPEIVVAPASQAVVLGGTANFGVVARFNGALRYSWYFGSDRSNPIGSASQIKLRNVVAEQFGTYTVRVEDASNPAAYVEVSARLTQKTDPVLNNSTRVSRGWWVYGVTGTADNPANDRSGFFVQERNTDSDGKITAGKSAWFWLTASASTVDDWSVGNQTVTEAADSTRSEYSIVADRDSFGELESFVISGLVEAGAAASIFGAPDLMEGEYQVGVPLFLEMSWDDAGRSAVELLGESASLDSVTGKELIRDVLRQILGLPMGGGGSQTPSGAEED